ncbi:hypothetical protein C0199_01530 [Candidatus Bathyarchaeota archaeon]|nr:MAG: hypothetical protein C0199_01530 [Candidatus Bathyarchaeota archaeon]
MEVEETQEETQFSEGPDEQELEQAPQEPVEEEQAPEQENRTNANNQGDRSSFIHGLSVGLGLGCISTFIIMWVVIFFTPQIPQTLTYESMLSMFIYPMLYLLAVGLIALTAGIVREYYVRK